jgi:hypothetical protein
MIVTPVKKLFNSSLVHDVVTKGRQFAVDMNTGELTILPTVTPKTVESANQSIVVKLLIKSKIDNDLIHSVNLSKNIETAFVQIEDWIEYSSNNIKDVEFRNSDGKLVWEVVRIGLPRWERRIADSYKKFINQS